MGRNISEENYGRSPFLWEKKKTVYLERTQTERAFPEWKSFGTFVIPSEVLFCLIGVRAERQLTKKFSTLFFGQIGFNGPIYFRSTGSNGYPDCLSTS